MGLAPDKQKHKRSLTHTWCWLVIACMFVASSGCQARRTIGLKAFSDGFRKGGAIEKKSICDTEYAEGQACEGLLYHETRWRALGTAIEE